MIIILATGMCFVIADMSDSIFVDVLRLLPLLHVINEEHCKTLNSMKMTMPEVVQPMPELHQEVYDGQM